ncbi:hypothetical protein N7G03_000745 [Salmonella enterica]|nr:hypothetical protein [Salmonella enterica]EEE3045328.1 hypothetical protein [Salmonella enterica subsp. enterica serovar Duisburg]EAM3911992.1 hypothetical protein [Salmonella enterica]EAN2234593.1 hypothetical protein [Salmonella enterica]EAN6204414.1 hypothetical protein [Salmonella enterica]
MESGKFDNINSSVYKLSWIAYIRPVIIFLIIFLIGISLSQSQTKGLSVAGYFVIVAALVNFLCSLLFLKTLKMWVDDDGVWLFRGIFPWTKGTVGTTWRDISDASYFTGFISWTTKSYRIRVGHRFTKTSELVIPHVKNGNLAVMEINETIKSKYKDKE